MITNNYNTTNFFNSIRNDFDSRDILSKILGVNIMVFLFLLFTGVVFFLTGRPNYFVKLLSVPASLDALIMRPWGIITYMFTHKGFFHLLFNMIFLYWSGRLFLEHFSQKKLLRLYILGGLSGAILYILAFNFLSVFSNSLNLGYTIGASAAVFAIFFGIAFYSPQRTITIIIIGQVKLYQVALFFAVFDLLRIPEGNAGGHISHLGGALAGLLFALWMKQYKTANNYKQNYQYNKDYAYNQKKQQNDDDINEILDKISKSGYESLSSNERKKLFKSSYKK